uniref:Protein kinase domain-containing protein n=1 Tax=Bionectria ochroleuca TaxID=29856 RepID=A0A8H7NGU6_BIOOC
MSLSPVVTLQQPQTVRSVSSPLKTLASGQTSSNGTPRPAAQPAPKAVAPATLDVAEQMNEEEKRKYVKGKKLGEGTYAIVFLGHLRANPAELVAIKKIKMQKEYTEGMPPDAVRELKHLQELHHPNIISLQSVFSSKDQNVNLVLEYLPLGDLEMLIRDTTNVHYGAADIKAWMGMLVRAIWFCHENFVLHRDIKPNNLLIAADGEVKLADFGLARGFGDIHSYMTSNVITRWYRPPSCSLAPSTTAAPSTSGPSAPSSPSSSSAPLHARQQRARPDQAHLRRHRHPHGRQLARRYHAARVHRPHAEPRPRQGLLHVSVRHRWP